MSYTYYYGYDCYGYGCLENPPGVQLPDPDPLPDIEADYVPPTVYTSTRSFTAFCPGGTQQIGPASTVPVMTSPTAPSGIVTDSSELAGFEGWRAFGTGPSWRASAGGYLQYQFAAAQTIVAFAITPDSTMVNVPVKGTMQGSNDGATWTTLANILQTFSGARTQISIPLNGSYLYYRLTLNASADRGNTYTAATGVALLELLGVNTNVGITKTASATSVISQANADQLALAAATLAAQTALAITGCQTVYSSNQTVTVKCGVGTYDGNNNQGSTQSASATSFISQQDADQKATAAATAAANATLFCTGSNNTQPIAIPANGVASPFPSVQYVTGAPAVITRLRVTLHAFTHQSESDVQVFLLSPTGKGVLLQQKCGTSANLSPPIELTYDSASVTSIPQVGATPAGSYLPTSYGSGPTAPPAPAPQISYPASFAALLGDNPNGAWSLWIVDIVNLDTGACNNGWSIQIN